MLQELFLFEKNRLESVQIKTAKHWLFNSIIFFASNLIMTSYKGLLIWKSTVQLYQELRCWFLLKETSPMESLTLALHVRLFSRFIIASAKRQTDFLLPLLFILDSYSIKYNFRCRLRLPVFWKRNINNCLFFFQYVQVYRQ